MSGDDSTVTVQEAADAAARAAESEETLERVRRYSHLLDDAYEIPVIGYEIGLDPVIGILPVAGDLPTTAVSVYIVMEAAYLGAPRATLARMVLNVLVDATFGSLPLVGPVFDAVWKANARNVALLEDRIGEGSDGARDRRLLAALTVALVVGVLGVTLAVGLLAGWLVTEAGLL